MKIMAWFGLVLSALSAAGDVILAKLGQVTTLECNANTYNTLEWLHENDRIVSVDGRTGRQRKVVSDIAGRSTVRGTSLVVTSLKEEDAGRFRCIVDRKSREYLLLLTSVSSTPSGDLKLGSEATLCCQVKGLGPGSTVQWKGPDKSTTALETVQLKPVTNSHSGTWECLFTHNSVTYTEKLEVRVKAPETAATSPPEKGEKEVGKPGCTNCTIDPPPKNPVLLELSWWVWVAIGVGSLVVIVLIIIIIVTCKKIRRRKRKYQRNQNGHHPLNPRQYCQCNRPTAAAKPQQGRRREKPVALPRQPLLME
ncbi:CD4-2 molecule, tandem duplicate 2 [Cheilinus undulatus]|uniref:CD4-2 molecule, tandem duplicate 2 n=1 Tax=Cheilinus undulatus TaxID=241271 RepID=UPI001BD43387|nr:CD4-2 molecule, tandem duplicate 2 [Cheilinus undulatus]XP_041649418.1 CD4-2 molecule, tandem duplicate 2 [Cheilinus undulatus]